MRRSLVVALAAVTACSPMPAHDGGADDAAVATSDSGADAAVSTVDSGSDATVDSGVPDSGLPDAAVDSGIADAGTDAGFLEDSGTRVTLPQNREMRAVWVATVLNIDFPTSNSLGADAGIAQLGALVDNVASLNLNAIVFQVRPESDALYVSSREPWSRFLTGTQGQNPGYDPLQTLLTLAHARGIEVHAWINPYRAKTSTSVTTAAGHISRVLAANAITYNNQVVMDPSAEAVRAWVVSEVTELTHNYDLDGVHFDDYFYPYPTSTPFPDEPQFQAYVSDGGTLGKLDWRRNNVNELVRRVSEGIASEKPWVRFGISPFGIYRPGMPAGITGLDAYNEISCDPLKWLDQHWVHYVAPQLYWPTTQTAQAFGPLVSWWADQVHPGQSIFSGHAISKLGDTSAWTLTEFRNQVQLSRAQAPEAAGQFWFSYSPLKTDAQGVKTMFKNDLYPRPALPPPVSSATTVAPPRVFASGNTVAISHVSVSALRVYAVYGQSAGQWRLEQIVPASTTSISLTAGTWAISAVDRADVESPGIELQIP